VNPSANPYDPGADSAILAPMQRSILTLIVLVGLGCSGDSMPEGAVPMGPITVDNLATSVASAYCQGLFRCPSSRDVALMQVYTGDVSACPSRLRSIVADQLEDTIAQVRAGRVRIDDGAIRSCLATMAATCSGDVRFLSVCPTAFVGSVAVGGGCWRAMDCAAGGYCNHGDVILARMCPGTCRPQKASGDMCTTHQECAPSGGAASACQGGRCVAVRPGVDAPAGRPCGLVASGTNEARRVLCASGSRCVSQSVDDAQCRAGLAEGTPCRSDDLCAAGTACLASGGTTTTTCRRVLTASAGATCTASATPLCNALERVACSATGVCESTGSGTLGGACRRGDFYALVSCDAGLYCEATTNTCRPRLGAGQTCVDDFDCLSFWCDRHGPPRCLERPCN
jgi:hypothetical protein